MGTPVKGGSQECGEAFGRIVEEKQKAARGNGRVVGSLTLPAPVRMSPPPSRMLDAGPRKCLCARINELWSPGPCSVLQAPPQGIWA